MVHPYAEKNGAEISAEEMKFQLCAKILLAIALGLFEAHLSTMPGEL